MIAGLVLAAIAAVAAGLFGRRAWFLYRLVRAGRPIPRFDDVPTRVRNEAVIVLGQRKMFQRLVPGLMHAAIFWGFIVLVPTIVIALIGIVDKHTTIPWLGEQGWFALLVDVFAVLRARRHRHGVCDPQGAAAASVRRQPPARGRPDPARDRGHHRHARAVACGPDRARPERVPGGLVAARERALEPVRSGLERPRRSSACWSGRTC